MWEMRAQPIWEQGVNGRSDSSSASDMAKTLCWWAFTTHRGTVIAASDWGSPAERKRIRAALPDSYEALFHDVGVERFLLTLRADPITHGLRVDRLERAIGVVYLPETERTSHYFTAALTRQFDAVVHCDETSALEPLDPLWEAAAVEPGELPEAYPSGL